MSLVFALYKGILSFWLDKIHDDVYARNSSRSSQLKLIDCFTGYLERAYVNSKNTGAFNVTGHPALSINAGFSEGLPVGMMIVGRKFDEATVLNVAYAYEKIRDTSS